MAEVKGSAAVNILNEEDVIKEFADTNKPIPVQVLDRLGFILNKNDNFVIKKEYQEKGPTSGGAMLHNCLIQRYSDQPDKFTLKQFIDVLAHFKTNVKLTNLLYSKCYYFAGTEVSHYDLEIIGKIKTSLQNKCENVRQAWRTLLEETSLEKCFVEPEIVEERDEHGEKRQKATGKSISSYKELFDIDTRDNRIVIEGDPGMGKTTYINKIALDWTWDEESEHYSDNSQFLQSKFSSVFLIPLRSLNSGAASSFAQAASLQLDYKCGSWLCSKYESNPTECLLILDAFDEYDGSCEEINQIIDGTRFGSLKVIVTTRPSHLGRLANKKQWLSITGLTTPEKRERFLDKQGWDKLTERDMIIDALSNFGTLWNTPLYLAMLCVLYKAKKVTGFDPLNPNCFYVLVKLFTDHIISRKAREGTKEGPQLSKLKIKSYIQKCAIQQFTQSNHWIEDYLETPATSSDIEDLGSLAEKIGLITVHEELSPDQSLAKQKEASRLFTNYFSNIMQLLNLGQSSAVALTRRSW